MAEVKFEIVKELGVISQKIMGKAEDCQKGGPLSFWIEYCCNNCYNLVDCEGW